ncbi:MAG TPA: hypothetical protein PKC80_10620 [Burkholderiaceae bacterium]|nr:hypothetical protein [Burkholderiaceae bacterium]
MSIHTYLPHSLIQIAIYLIAIYAYITPATAQNNTKTSIEQSRILIRQEKAEIESSYKEKERLCLQKFVATPCINDAKHQKTKALANIKQKELVLNEQERALKKAKIESKPTKSPTENSQSQTPEQNQSTDAQRNKEEQANVTQLQKQQQKLTQAEAKAKLRVNQTDKKKIESTKKANRRADKGKQESVNAAKYQNKVAAAQARKNAIDERNANRSKPQAAPLPLPSPIPK